MPYEIVDVPEARALVATATCANSQLGPVIGEMFGGLIARFPEAELIEAPRVYYKAWRENDCDVQAAFIIDPNSLPGGQLTTFPATRAAVAVHYGPYEGLPDAWTRLWGELQRDGIQTAPSAPWDSYEVGALQTENVHEWETGLYIPIV